MRLSPRFRAWAGRAALGVFFLAQLLVAVVVHLDTARARRTIERWANGYLSRELRGQFDIGQIERLSPTSVWVRHVSVYDEQQRRVVTLERVRINSSLSSLVRHWFTSTNSTTLVIESIRADDAHLRLHPDPFEPKPSILAALEPDPQRSATPAKPAAPYRVFFPNVALGKVTVDSTYPELVAQGATLRSISGQLLFTNEGVAASVKAFTFDWSARDSVPVHAFGNLEYRSPTKIWGDIHATLANVPLTLRLLYQKSTLDLALRTSNVAPAEARKLVPDWPFVIPVSTSVRAFGPLDELALRLELDAGPTHVESAGRLSLGHEKKGEFSVEVHQLDIGALFGPALPSSIDAAARVNVTFEEDQPHLAFDGVVYPGRIAQLRTPTLDVVGQIDSEGVMLSGRSRDAAFPVRAAAVWRNRQLDIDAQIDGFDLARLGREQNVAVHGTGRLRARGKIANGELEGSLNAGFEDVAVTGASIDRIAVTADFAGPLPEPMTWTTALRADVSKLRTPYAQFDRMALRATGTPAQAHVTLTAERPGDAKLAFSATASPFRQPQLQSGRFEMTRGASAIVLTAESLAISDGAIGIDELKLEGSAGYAHGSLGLSPSFVFGRLMARSLDLAVLSDLLGLPARSMAGRANLELDVDTRLRPAKGFLRLESDRATVGWLTNVSGNVELGLLGNHLMAQASVHSDLVDEIHADADLELAGGPLRLNSYLQSEGTSSVDLAGVRLDRLGMLLGWLKDGFGLSGTANIRVAAERNAAHVFPNLTISAVTEGLRMVLPMGSRQLRLENKEVLWGTSLQGESGDVKSDLVISRYGVPKASLNLTTRVAEPDELLRNPRAVATSWQAWPFEAFVSLPPQSLAELGGMWGTTLGTGDAELKVWLKGPIDQAHLVTEVQGRQLVLQSLGNTVPFDAQGLLEYTRSSGEARVLLAVGKQTESWLQVNGLGTIQNCADRPLCIRDWEGRVEAGLFGLPLEVLPGIGPLGFSGQLRGVLSANRSTGTTRIDGVLPIDNLRMSAHPLGQTLLHVRSDDDQLVSGAKLMDGGAHIDFEAQVPMNWQALVPTRRDDGPMRFIANASGYDAGILQPWLEESVTNLSGELDGTVEATYGRMAGAAEGAAAQLALGGHATVRHGHATIRALGLTFGDLALSAQASSTADRTMISIPQLSASVGNGTNNVAGAAVIELDGMRLRRLAARLDKADELPLVANSVTLATLTGRANVEMVPMSGGYDVSVEVGELDVRLPRSSAREVVGLTENPDIVVLQPLGPDAWRKANANANGSAIYRVRLALGKKSRVTRTDFTLPVTGNPEVVIGDRVRPSGIVQLESSGRLQLLGKVFVIDRGRVTFDPDQPSNPRFDVTATWRGPTHLVTIQIQGQKDQARLRFTSDPPLASESQIMALLLGGSSSGDSSASAGLGVGATLFNELLSDTALSSLEVRTSSDERHANYTAAVPIRENLWFEATYQSPTNTNVPGSPTQRGFSGTVDYRFRRNWSVRSEVGTLGAGADLMWQYRY